MRILQLSLFVVICLGSGVGCQAPAPIEGPTRAVLAVSDRDAFLDGVLTTMREMDIAPRSIDREAGVAISQPTTSAQWFEFWRTDAPGGYQLAESSLQTVQRVVTVTVAAPGADGTPVTVQVDKYRLNTPPRQVTSASSALGIYSASTPTVEGRRGSAEESWTPTGRDPLLEEIFLDRLAARAARVAPAPSESEPSSAPGGSG